MQKFKHLEDHYGITPLDTKCDPVGFFLDTEDAVMALVNELYDTDHLNKIAIHNALWWLCVNYGEGKHSEAMDHYEANDLVIEHWRDQSILNNNP